MSTVYLRIALAAMICHISLFAFSQTWTGNVSAAWSVGGNWSTGVIPAAGSTVIISSPGANAPVLDGNITINNLNFNGTAALDLNGFTLTATNALTMSAGSLNLNAGQITCGTATITGGSLSTGTLSANSLANLANTTCTDMTIIKRGGTANTPAGGNTFNGTTEIQLASTATANLTLSNTTGDTYNGNVTFRNDATPTARVFTIANAGATTISGNATLVSNGPGGITIGSAAGSGTCTIQGVIEAGAYVATAPLTFRRVTQVSTAANGNFTVASFTALNTTLNGNFGATTSGALSLTTSNFERSCSFSGATLTLTGCHLATTAGTAAITRTGTGGNNVLVGGNTIGPVTITQSCSGGNLTFANTTGDTFLGDVTLVNTTATRGLFLAFAGHSTIAGSVAIDNVSSSGNAVQFGNGANGGSCRIEGTIQNTQFTQGTLRLNRVNQVSASANGSFAAGTFAALKDTIEGAFSFTGATTITLDSAFFERSCTFSGTILGTFRRCRLATTAGTAIVTLTGANNNNIDLIGGNVWGPAIISNTKTAANNGRLQLSNTLGDTFLGDLTLSNTSSGRALTTSVAGLTTIAGDLILENSSAGGITIGTNGTTGTTLLTGIIQNIGFTGGPLTLRRLRQESTSANAALAPTVFTALNDTLYGSFEVNSTTSSDIQYSFFENTVILTTPNFASLRNSRFATTSGTATLTKNGGTANSTSFGSNTFGPVTISLTGGTGDLTMENAAGDTFLGDVTLINTSTAEILTLINAGSTTIAGNLTLQNSSTGGITFGTASPATGTAVVTGTIQSGGFAGGQLSIRRTRQVSTSANGVFTPTAFNANSDTIFGEITVNASGAINLNTVRFENSCTLTSPSFATVVGCKFSLLGGSTVLTQTGTTDNSWAGNNRFGDATITVASTGYIRMANNTSSPDTVDAGKTLTLVRATGADVLNPARTSNLYLRGNLSTVGSGANITFGGNGGRVVVDGNAAQTFASDPAITTTITLLTMSTTGTFALNSPLTIATDVAFSSGVIEGAGSNVLILNDNITTSIAASAASYVDGPVRKVGNDAFVFPLGDNGIYGPIEISAPTNTTHHFTAQYFYQNPNPTYSTASLSFPIDHVSEQEYWSLERTNGTSTPDLTMIWGPQSGGVSNPGSMLAARWNGSAWSSEGGSGASGTVSNGSFVSFGLSNFGIFTFGTTSSPAVNLPVVLTNWQATEKAGQVHLFWQTAQEHNAAYFEVERSADNRAFTTLGRVAAAGESNALLDYEFIDLQPMGGSLYYRLRMVDADGSLELSDVIALERGDATVQAIGFPNPANNLLQVQLNTALAAATPVSLIDIKGNVVERFVIAPDQSSLLLNTSALPAGGYLLLFDTEFWIEPLRIQIEH